MMDRNELLQRPSFMLALHGWPEQYYFEDLLHIFTGHFTKVGVQPLLGSIQVAGTELLKTLSYRSLQKRLAQKQYCNLTHLSLSHLLDKQDKQSDDFAISVSNEFDDQHAYILDGISQKTEAKQHVLDFLRILIGRISPCYGYSLEMPLRDNPILFSAGMFATSVHADVESKAWQEASHAMIGGRKHRQGKFRHVFEINVLSPPHLANSIGKMSFSDWVKTPGHGLLEQWKENVWVWFVPREDRIRCANILQFNGLLTAPAGFENELIG